MTPGKQRCRWCCFTAAATAAGHHRTASAGKSRTANSADRTVVDRICGVRHRQGDSNAGPADAARRKPHDRVRHERRPDTVCAERVLPVVNISRPLNPGFYSLRTGVLTGGDHRASELCNGSRYGQYHNSFTSNWAGKYDVRQHSATTQQRQQGVHWCYQRSSRFRQAAAAAEAAAAVLAC